MFARRRQQSLVNGVDVVAQLGADLVAYQELGSARLQALAGGLESELQELAGALPAQQVAELAAGRQRNLARGLQGVEDELLAAQRQEPHVSVILVGRPAERAQADPAGGELSQPLPRPVPVDQEDQPRPEERQVGEKFLSVLGLISPQAEMIEFLAQPRGSLRHCVVPAHGEGVEQALEEKKSFQMHIGVCQRHPQAGDVNDQDVGLRHADVVLEDQPTAAAGGRCSQAGVGELQRRVRFTPAMKAWISGRSASSRP